MAGKALAIDGDIERDYWMGGVKTEDGTWRWRSGDPMDSMDYTNWCEGCPDTGEEGWVYSQLLKKGYPGTLDTFYWAREICDGNADDGVICEINLEK